ncbi:flavin monoamine oxidase family protein [Balneola sp. MJW-20]|uniref:flavin monoamine oxidase family protein n=1 Tax=Gracilimonas aurantiaca TaxID=3234185 RepID=UPI0034660F16
MIRADVVILGAGLTGLTLNYLLLKQNLDVVILEARNRTGGRIYTTNRQHEAPIEMGATWLGPQHRRLISLLKDLNIEVFEQTLGKRAIYEPTSMGPHQLVTLPPDQQSSYRIRGGTSKLIQILADEVSDDSIYFDQPARSVTEDEKGLTIKTSDLSFESKIVVSTLPPRLLQKSVELNPGLSEEVTRLLARTHTWMGESIKFGLTYQDPFWRKDNLSGTVFSNVGPITEMYDHSDFEDDHYALKGFLNGSYFTLSLQERKNMVVNQLRKYYGDQAEHYLNYHELVWTHEEYTFTPYDEHVLPHQNNGHELYNKPHMNGRFFIAGAETSLVSPGYMDGAVSSAERVAAQIMAK